jgi:hypothetical protein
MAKVLPQDEPVIAEFQDRRRAFRAPWNRNCLFLLAPGFALAALGHGYFGQEWMVWVGVPIFAAGLVRGWLLWREHLRCPQCETVQNGEGQIPYLTCRSCGARLSVGFRDQL